MLGVNEVRFDCRRGSLLRSKDFIDQHGETLLLTNDRDAMRSGIDYLLGDLA
jgi:hypothetical protein